MSWLIWLAITAVWGIICFHMGKWCGKALAERDIAKIGLEGKDTIDILEAVRVVRRS